MAALPTWSAPAPRKVASGGSRLAEVPDTEVHSPTARKLSSRHAGALGSLDAWTAAGRLLLRGGRRRAAAAATAAALLLLAALVLHGGGPGVALVAPSWPTDVAALQSEVEVQGLPRRQNRQQALATAGSLGRADGEAAVEFTAPGLWLPLSQALRLDLPSQPAEQRLLQEPMMGNAGSSSVGGNAWQRPTLDQVVKQWQRTHGPSDQAGGAAAVVGSPRTLLQPAASASEADAAPRQQAAGQQAPGSPAAAASPDSARTANELQALLQKIEAGLYQEALRTGRAKPPPDGMWDRRRLQGSAAGGVEGGSVAAGGASDVPLHEGPAGTDGSIRLLVAITTACCSETARSRRAAIRATWGAALGGRDVAASGSRRGARVAVAAAEAPQEPELPPGMSVELRFFLSQPADAETAQRWQPVIQVGPSSGPSSVPCYTHVLKADDDAFVRIHHVLKALHDPPVPPAVAASAAGGAAPAQGLQAQVAAWARQEGKPLYSDGLAVYSGAKLARRVGRLAGGYFPIRDPGSKWQAADLGALYHAKRGWLYISYDELPDAAVPFGVKYLAGWAYVLSRDMAAHALGKANRYLLEPGAAPAWFGSLAWEDVMVGLLMMDAVREPQDHAGFRAAWRACPADTAVRHLDVDAPRLVAGLWEQERSGLWDTKPVQCSSGSFVPGDYTGEWGSQHSMTWSTSRSGGEGGGCGL
eukprot:scaffold19.g1796.t1